jgi:hypothetical protein
MPQQLPRFVKMSLEVHNGKTLKRENRPWGSNSSFNHIIYSLQPFHPEFIAPPQINKVDAAYFNESRVAIEKHFESSIFFVYTKEEIDSTVAALNSKCDESLKSSLKSIATAKDECLAFTRDEVEKIVRALSEASETEVSSAFNKAIEDSVQKARQADAETISQLRNIISELDARVKKLESPSAV